MPFVSTNLSLLDLYFSKKARVKWRMNNLPTVVSTAFGLLFSEQQHLEKMSTWQRRLACPVDQQAWGRGPGVGAGKQIHKEQWCNEACFLRKLLRKETWGGDKDLLSGYGIFIGLNELLDSFMLSFGSSKGFYV